MKDAVVEWKLPNQPPPALVSDNASNMDKAGTLFNSEAHIKCYAHTLNLAAQKSLKVKQVSHILSRMRRIVGFFHRSSVAASKLKSQAEILNLPAKKLVIDVQTRCNSAYDMIDRFLKMQCAVTSVLRMKEVAKFRDKDINSFTDDDISLAEQVMECLKPLKTVTTSLCSETMPTLSIILPVHHTILKKMEIRENDSTAVKLMKRSIIDDLQHRYDAQADLLSIASFLDPRFKTLPFLTSDTEREEVYSNVVNKVKELPGMQVKVKQEPKDDVDAQPPLPSLELDEPNNLHIVQEIEVDEMVESQVDAVDTNNISPEKKRRRKI